MVRRAPNYQATDGGQAVRVVCICGAEYDLTPTVDAPQPTVTCSMQDCGMIYQATRRLDSNLAIETVYP